MGRAPRPLMVAVRLSAVVLMSACASTAPPPPKASPPKGTASRSADVTYHTVRKGDTLYSIAWRYGVDYRRVAYWNGIAEPFTIYPGQRIRLLDVGPAPVAARPANRKPAPPVSSDAPARTKISKSSAKQSIKYPGPVESRSAGGSGADPAPVSPTTTAQATSGDGEVVERWVWPTRGKVITSFVQSGQRGIDISGRSGQTIQATASGTVVYSGGGLIGYGKLIIVKHNKRFLSAYAHNRQVFVEEGDDVHVGQRIATMGSTGTDRVKLHFEIRRDGKPVNPLRYLPR